ncbi:MAG: hypothetical protein FWG41_06475, partial [Methanomassiliicoccaceae archaeon]|nr:hypothetical protein [Methanomassiliicoccaceae archaeon]
MMTANAGADSHGGDAVLFDMGNGNTMWSDISNEGTIDDVLRAAATAGGLNYGSSSNKITINGVTETTIGGASSGGSLSSSGTTG